MIEPHDQNTLVAIARLEERVCGVSDHLSRIDNHFERIEEMFRSSMAKAVDGDEKLGLRIDRQDQRITGITAEMAEARGAVNAMKWLVGILVAGLTALSGLFGIHASKGH